MEFIDELIDRSVDDRGRDKKTRESCHEDCSEKEYLPIFLGRLFLNDHLVFDKS